jgi:NAD(P)-dependent dehydrogenase (short-subunit alcohol dehydrogenase family)
VPVDVADVESMKALADAVYERHGRVDIAFLNAGLGTGAGFTDDDVSHWHTAIQAHVVFPPITKSNLAGDPEVMRFGQQALAANGLPVVLAEPEEVAVTVVEAIRNGDFWARHHHEADIDWQDAMVRARADAVISRSAPDAYPWGGPTST